MLTKGLDVSRILSAFDDSLIRPAAKRVSRFDRRWPPKRAAIPGKGIDIPDSEVFRDRSFGWRAEANPPFRPGPASTRSPAQEELPACAGRVRELRQTPHSAREWAPRHWPLR